MSELKRFFLYFGVGLMLLKQVDMKSRFDRLSGQVSSIYRGSIFIIRGSLFKFFDNF